MTNANTLLERLRDSLTTLQQRWANLGPDARASLIHEIEDHEKAITLTEQLAAGHLPETAWREQLRPLLVTIEARQATEAVSALNIGGVNFSDISGSAINVGHIDAGVQAGGDVVLKTRISGESFLNPGGSLLDAVCEAVTAVTGSAPNLSTGGGTSDARFIKNVCPVVEFGLVGATMHQIDERVAIADVEGLTAIYRRFLDLFFT